jgi:hypothetical protein
MPVGFNRRVPDNRRLRAQVYSDLPATLSESLSATFQDPTLRPTQLLTRELQTDRTGAPEEVDPEALSGKLGPRRQFQAQARAYAGSAEKEDLSPLRQPQELNQRYGHLGLNFETPTREDTARLLAENKRAEIVRQDVIARSPQGVGAEAARFGTALLGSAVDPINIASAFLPVVGQARYAGWVARMGATRARLSRGAVEGTAGAAAVEPLVAGLSRQQQLDYTMADALVNVALGGILGGGLHAGAGKIGDYLSGVDPQTRAQAWQTATAQTVQGQRVDVEPILRSESARESGLRASVSRSAVDPGPTTARAPEGDLDAFLRDQGLSVVPEVGRPGSPTSRAQPNVLVPSVTRQGEARIFETRREAQRSIRGTQRRQDLRVVETNDGRYAVARERPNVELEREPGGAVKRFPNRRSAQKFIDRVRAGDPNLSIVPIGDSNFAVARGLSDRDRQALEIAPNAGRLPDIERERFSPVRGARITPEQAAEQVARRARDLRQDASADVDAARQASTDLGGGLRSAYGDTADIDAEVQAAEELVADLQERGEVSAADQAELTRLDEQVQRAEQYGRGAREAALCISNRA